MKIEIRKELIEDYKIVEKLTKEAFYKEETFKEKGYGCDEHYLLHLLREKDGINELSFVATHKNSIVGHIIYSKAYILTEDSKRIDILSFGPVSVAKDYQNQGIGTLLINHSIQAAKSLGYGAIVIYGHPNYYPRFGFVPAIEYSIATEDGHNFPAFMVLELIKGYLDGVHGKAYLGEVFKDFNDPIKILEFDKDFI